MKAVSLVIAIKGLEPSSKTGFIFRSSSHIYTDGKVKKQLPFARNCSISYVLNIEGN